MADIISALRIMGGRANERKDA
ncbi:hypothetical protein RB2654_13960 [Rhodobacterales bacterium HTCC2654]|uniref:Uncharacterized protein n=1 Tax=Maritimibacter alkaliphilus HTCC2654 TaxID=314271 RepID=A3VGJ1_9RHOB|nr:hypothetical protein RB2654_13960 [Rhodobacterales bacterium HTCC2654] [Maritimibacter alkaliphilus HTCC2654]